MTPSKTYKIIVDEKIHTLEELRVKLAEGAYFAVFYYNISFIRFCVFRVSPVFLVEDNNSLRKLKKRYNLLSSFFGWWSLKGMASTWGLIASNSKGGMNITEDIMKNITEESFEKREVLISRTEMIFDKPERSELKTFRKCLLPYLRDNSQLDRIIIGWYLNTATPYYIIAIDAKDLYTNYTNDVKTILAKQFYKHVKFEFIPLEEENPLCQYLLKQGLVLEG